MKLNLVSDLGGRAFARAMRQAYDMGYNDAVELNKADRRIYPRKTGEEIVREIAIKALKEHASFLRQAYGAGMWQYKREIGK